MKRKNEEYDELKKELEIVKMWAIAKVKNEINVFKEKNYP